PGKYDVSLEDQCARRIAVAMPGRGPLHPDAMSGPATEGKAVGVERGRVVAGVVVHVERQHEGAPDVIVLATGPAGRTLEAQLGTFYRIWSTTQDQRSCWGGARHERYRYQIRACHSSAGNQQQSASATYYRAGSRYSVFALTALSTSIAPQVVRDVG